MKIRPDVHISNIFEITPQWICRHKIHLLFVDVDNTLAEWNQTQPSQRVKEWAEEIKKHCHVIFISNNTQQRVSLFCGDLGEYVSFALKPFGLKAYRLAKHYHIDKKHVACVGDQLFTDVLGAHLHGFMAVYCDPLAEKDIIYTKISRKFEKILLKKMEK